MPHRGRREDIDSLRRLARIAVVQVADEFGQSHMDVVPAPTAARR